MKVFTCKVVESFDSIVKNSYIVDCSEIKENQYKSIQIDNNNNNLYLSQTF